MNSQNNLLPPIPRPPHDPTFRLLDGRTGWGRGATMEKIETDPESGGLVLAEAPGAGRSLTEPSGSLGGVRPPRNVAVGPAGAIYLADAASSTLKRFDSCECEFRVVDCLGGEGPGPRQFNRPAAIGVRGGDLFVCDTGNHRLAVFALHGFALRGFWSPPEGETAATWSPSAIAFGRCGCVWVADPANLLIHRFNPWGTWIGPALSGLGSVTDLAVDCQNRLHAAASERPDMLWILDQRGNRRAVRRRPHEISRDFPPAPFPVDSHGHISLDDRCLAGSDRKLTFDLGGRPVDCPGEAAAAYEREGDFQSAALDSKLHRCRWHRVRLSGRLPAGTSIRVRTYTAETPLSALQIANLPADAWSTDQRALSFDGSEWDCMVRGDEGRYLWLRLSFRGDGSATPSLHRVIVEFPRLGPRRHLPAVFSFDPGGADLTDRFLGLFDTTLRGLERKLDHLARFFDPMAAPAQDPGNDFLTWLASWVGLTLNRRWPLELRRRLLKSAARMYHLRGTREGLWRQLLLFLGMEAEPRRCPNDQPVRRCGERRDPCLPQPRLPGRWRPPPLILEHYQLRRWLHLSRGRLGEHAVLWGSRIVNRSQLGANARAGVSQLTTKQDPFRDPFHVYAHQFTVFAPARFARRGWMDKGLRALIETQKPAHTQFELRYVKPAFRIGIQSMIGLDSVVGRYPEGIRLNRSKLGGTSVISDPEPKAGGPAYSVGRRSRVGSGRL